MLGLVFILISIPALLLKIIINLDIIRNLYKTDIFLNELERATKKYADFENQINVLFYNSPQDYAVMLTTKDNDEVYLYKNGANKPFNYLYMDMNQKTSIYTY